MTFKELNLNNPLQNVLEELEYIYPTPIQIEALPIVLSGKDMIGVAQTGTGKTFAYLLPILKSLKYSEQKNPRILILVPTRELVVQVVNEIEKLSQYMTLRTIGVYGGTNINTQREKVFQGMDILVATPGRLMDLALDGNIRLKSIQKLVIDEVDEMLNLGFRVQLNNVLDLLPERRQNLMFSATLTEDVEQLIIDFFTEPIKIEIAPSGTPLELIIQQAYHVPNFYTKVNLLDYLLKTDDSMKKVLVFTDNKRLADRLAEHLQADFGNEMGVIHSNKSQNFRLNAIAKFEKGENRILIATELIARGIDIQDVTHVVNFDTPTRAESYIHRIGRTGRADKAGVAMTFINEAEEEFQALIEEFMEQDIPLIDMPEEVKISNKFTDEERPNLGDKHYLKNSKLNGGGAYHDKKDKNKKENLGGSYKRKIKEKYKKPQTRSAKSKRKK